MGNTQAKNTASAIASEGINVSTTVAQQCTNGISQSVNFDCEGSAACPAGIASAPNNCSFSNITVNQLASANLSCFQNAAVNTSTNQSVSQSVTQQASAVAAGLSLSPTEASNIVSEAANLATSINTTISNTLTNAGNQSVGFYGSNCSTGFTFIDVNQMNNTLESGIQQSNVVTTATENLSQAISQKATAVNLGLVGVLIALAVVIIAVGYFFKNAAGGAVKLLIPIGILVGAYCGVAYWQKLWPWKKKTPLASTCSDPGSQSTCPAGQTCVSSGDPSGVTLGNSYCVPQCSTWQACPTGVCSTAGTCVSCSSSSQCPTSFPVCVNGTCYAACSATNPCSGAYSCQTGACIPTPNACQTTVNCPPNYTCTGGTCVASTTSLRSRISPIQARPLPSHIKSSPAIMAK